MTEEDIKKFIRSEDGKFCVYSMSGEKIACHDTREQAIEQLRAIEASKVKKEHEGAMDHLSMALEAKDLEECKKHIGLAVEAMKEYDAEDGMSKSSLKLTKNTDGSVDWELNIPFTKLNDEEHLVHGIVYEPDVIDSQGDSASPYEIKKAAHRFMLESQNVKIMHKDDANDSVKIVESFISPVSYRSGTQMIQKGSWVMVMKIVGEDEWKRVQSGELTGYSMSGRARSDNS